MCACRCGINVHLRDGADGKPVVRYIDGNREHPVNKGVLCGKGSAGIMQHYSPARLTKPLLRVGERGAGEFREIEWDEAIATALSWLSKIRADDPKKLEQALLGTLPIPVDERGDAQDHGDLAGITGQLAGH